MRTVSAHPVWDVPTRVFHWLLLVAVCTSWASYEFDRLSIHQWSGYTVLVLVLFRLTWGFLGSVHSRFSDFMSSPGTVLQYLKGSLPKKAGHNPLGAWSVLAMLLLLLGQAFTGLFNSDELMFDGPFFHALDSSWTDKLGELHATLFWILLGFIGLHVAAVMYYQFVRGDKLLGAMVSGGQGGRSAPVPLWRALLVLVFFATALAVAVYFAPAPKLPW